jgi:hypothetical protein
MKLRKQLKDDDNQSMNVTSIYFDGRKDETLTKYKQGDWWYSQITKEEHYVLVSEPGSTYIGHVSPKSSKGNDIADSILLRFNEIGLGSSLLVVGCDSTNGNTFAGSIGQATQSCETKPIAKFKPIVEGDGLPELSQEVLSDLSRDQQYLFNIIRGIREGSVSSNLARKKPGPINHSRWLTLANRVESVDFTFQKKNQINVSA